MTSDSLQNNDNDNRLVQKQQSESAGKIADLINLSYIFYNVLDISYDKKFEALQHSAMAYDMEDQSSGIDLQVNMQVAGPWDTLHDFDSWPCLLHWMVVSQHKEVRPFSSWPAFSAIQHDRTATLLLVIVNTVVSCSSVVMSCPTIPYYALCYIHKPACKQHVTKRVHMSFRSLEVPSWNLALSALSFIVAHMVQCHRALTPTSC